MRTWTESSQINILRLNQSVVGLERSGTRTWTCTNTTFIQELCMTVLQKVCPPVLYIIPYMGLQIAIYGNYIEIRMRLRLRGSA